ncbi:MAG: hypothetical protein O8C64_05340 [Candidatus Methanoperedens sp.]|nr:hypothetical protein [Candidatus Methanoperedens sp.]MCZ7405112.1 hypothetical protein [Candidatus Methanoperedens sp.]
MTETEKKIEKVPVVKSTTPEEKKKKFIEGVKKTVFPAFISAAFAILFFVRFGDSNATGDPSWFPVVLLVLLLSYYIQRLIYPLIGVKVKEFETKDWLYVEFLVIIYFWVIWILLLNQ